MSPASNATAPRKRSHARDFFMYLLTFVSLYVSAVSLWGVTAGIINRLIPDIIDQPYYYSLSDALFISGIAFLIIVYPIFYIMNRKLQREVAADQALAESGIRKWLTYITLLISIGFLVGAGIGILTQVIGGAFVVRFVIKAVAIIIIAGGIFGYYLHDVLSKTTDKQLQNLFSSVFTVLVVVGIIFGWMQIGSPAQQRLTRIDEQRINDLSSIASCATTLYNQDGKLPASLDEIRTISKERNVPCGEDNFSDPKTQQPYEYSLIPEQKTKYEICGTFDTKDSGKMSYSNYGYDWSHDAGRQCFTREVEIYNDVSKGPVPIISRPIE